MTTIRWTESARTDLIEIGDYIARREPAIAGRFIKTLMDSVLVLAEQPRAGRIVPETCDEFTRELIHGNYLIVYRILSAEVHVLSVFEGHKLLDSDQLE